MKVYSIFDDFGDNNVERLNQRGIICTVHPHGITRPDTDQMKQILENYDGVIIGTSQKIAEDMFSNITTQKVIATASVGLDHIVVPERKKNLVKIINTPKANAQSVAEYTIGCALACCKRVIEGRELYAAGKNNKQLNKKPEDLCGKTIGVIGAGNISFKIIEYASFLGMKVLCWTKHPEKHPELIGKGVAFTTLSKLVSEADVISVNLPNVPDTRNIISRECVNAMKKDAIFISVSRLDTIDTKVLFAKAESNLGFYVCLDIDLNQEIVSSIPDIPNAIVTPHIAGGTVETRKRMFSELTDKLIEFM